MDINIIQKKINKYRKKLRKSESLEKSDFYQSKLSYYNKLNQSGGAVNLSAKKDIVVIQQSFDNIVDYNTKINSALKEQLTKKKEELKNLKTEMATHKGSSKANVELTQKLVKKQQEIEELEKKVAESDKKCKSSNKDLSVEIKKLVQTVEDKNIDMEDTLDFIGIFSKKIKTDSDKISGDANGNGNGNGEIIVKQEDAPLGGGLVGGGGCGGDGGCGCGCSPKEGEQKGSGCGDEMVAPEELLGGGCGSGCGRLPILPLSNRN